MQKEDIYNLVIPANIYHIHQYYTYLENELIQNKNADTGKKDGIKQYFFRIEKWYGWNFTGRKIMKEDIPKTISKEEIPKTISKKNFPKMLRHCQEYHVTEKLKFLIQIPQSNNMILNEDINQIKEIKDMRDTCLKLIKNYYFQN